MSTTATSHPAVPMEGPATPPQLAQVRLENDALVSKLAQLAGAMRGLVRDLAMARRDVRDKQQQIEALRIENARLRAHVPPSLRTAVVG